MSCSLSRCHGVKWRSLPWAWSPPALSRACVRRRCSEYRERHGKRPHLSLVPAAVNRETEPCPHLLPALPQDPEPCPREGPKCDTPKCDSALNTAGDPRDGARTLAECHAGHGINRKLPLWSPAHAARPASLLHLPC